MTETSVSAESAVQCLRAAGLKLAVAESVSGGALAAALTSVPGASDVFGGGIVAYSAEAKVSVLGLDPELVRAHGLVSREVAVGMARGVATVMGAQVAAATTGAAGPDPHDGAPVGRVWVAVIAPGRELASVLEVPGERGEVVTQSVAQALRMLCDVVDTSPMRGTTVG